MPKHIHRPDYLHVEVMIQTRALIARSRRLLEESAAGTFLGRSRRNPSALNDHAPPGKSRAPLRAIDGSLAQKGQNAGSTGGEWQNIRTAPFCRDLELAVMHRGGVHALVFPCRRILRGWVKAKNNERLDVHPTHWREWKVSNSALFPIGLSS